VRVAGSLGVFANHEEEVRVLSLVERGQERVSGAIFRQKDGTRHAFGVIGGTCGAPDAVVLVVLERQPQPWRAPPLAALSQAWSVPTRSAS
jgi:hypothetical protein